MDLQELGQIIDLFLSKDLAELEIEENGRRVRLKRPGPGADNAASPPQGAAATPEAAAGAGRADIDAQYVTIDAPMVGTFYRAPAPGATPFMKEGQVVEKGQTLCILEAMKVMNEIECEVRARVISILAEDGQPVEYGEPLFLVEPL